jgi:hypothetical protein
MFVIDQTILRHVMLSSINNKNNHIKEKKENVYKNMIDYRETICAASPLPNFNNYYNNQIACKGYKIDINDKGNITDNRCIYDILVDSYYDEKGDLIEKLICNWNGIKK